MRIVYAIPVRQAEPLHDGSFAVLGFDTNVVTAGQLPATIVSRFLVAIAATHFEAQPGIEHTLTVRALNPNLAEVRAPLSLAFEMQPGSYTPLGWEVRSVASLAVIFPAVTAGTHVIELTAGRSDPISVPLVVKVET